MHILPAYYTTTNLRKRKQKEYDQSKHHALMKKMGLTDKIKNAQQNYDYSYDRNSKWREEYSATMRVENSTKEYNNKSLREVCNGGTDATAKRGVMTNIHKESEETRNAILAKAKRVMPLYNKGGLQVLTDSDDLKCLNKVAR